LKRQGVVLNRDVIYAATADEEAGKGNHGVGWLIDHHPEQVDALYVLTEGGGTDFDVNGKHFYTCQTGQKGIFRFRLHAKGSPGHGSRPHNDNAVGKLSKAIGALGSAHLPMHSCQTLKAFLHGVADTQDAETAQSLRDVLDEDKSEDALTNLPFDEETVSSLRALLRNTVSPTLLEAGSKINVIPAEATAYIDGRLAPGQTDKSFEAEIRPYIGDEIELIVDQYSPPLEADTNSPLYQTVVEVMGEHDSNALVVPSIMTGGTDAKHICPRRPETQVLGFMPHRQKEGEEEMNLIHGHDERTSIENLVFATKILYDVTCRFCETK
jgi:acetylornithine deacetylase/succinyl-diaminopimelate desuccinylase-like protein